MEKTRKKAALQGGRPEAAGDNRGQSPLKKKNAGRMCYRLKVNPAVK